MFLILFLSPVDFLLRALLPLGLVYPAGDVQGRLAYLAAPDVDLGAVAQQSLHN